MSYKFSRDIGYQPWGVTNPWVFANYGQPQRQRGYVSPMIFQTQEPHLRHPYLGGLGSPMMAAVRMAAVPSTVHGARMAATRVAATPERVSAARMAVSRSAPLAVRSRIALARMASSSGEAARLVAAAHRIAAARADSRQMSDLHKRAAQMAWDIEHSQDAASLYGIGATPPATVPDTLTANVTAQSVLDEELARSRRMEIVSVASLVLGVASYILFRRAVVNKNPGRRRRHRRHS